MKNWFVLLGVCVLAVFVFTGCEPSKNTLYLYNWADYVSPELIEEFEKANDCHVVYDTYDSNEALLAKLEAGAKGYDLIVPSHYILSTLIKSGLIAKIDHSKLNILNHIDPKVLATLPDPKCEYSIPYTLSYTGIGYNNEVIKDFKPSWKMFERTNLQNRATLLDDKREVIGAALLTAGRDPNSTAPEDLAVAKEIIHGWMKNISKFENEQYKNGIASKEFFMVMGYSGDLMQVVEDNPHVSFAIPEEGSLMSCDLFVIPKAANNPDLAYKFINFLFDPINTARNIEYIYYLCPNKDAYELLPEEVLENPAIFISDELFHKSAFTKEQGENEAILNKLWGEIKAGN